MNDLPLIALVVGPVLTGVILYVRANRFTQTIASLLQGLLLAGCLQYVVRLQSVAVITEKLSIHELPVGMALSLDSLSLVVLCLNNLLFFLMVIYSRQEQFMTRHFLLFLLSLQGFINGIFLSTDFFNVYLLVEVATVTAGILIMYRRDSRSIYDGLLYLMVNLTAMAFFLFGVGFLYKQFGVLDFATTAELLAGMDDPRPLIMPLAMLLTGVCLKAALMPLFSWLPKAHGTASAPSIVAALLSGVFIKSGVYLLIRITGIFSPLIDLTGYLLLLGTLTAIAGFVFAISQKDIKMILAYHTVSQIGLIIMGLNLGTVSGYRGGVYHILTHGIFKALLFLIAGRCIKIFGTRDITGMKGLWQHSRGLSLALILAVLSITGAPFLSGGYSKALIAYGSEGPLYTILFQVISLGTMVSFVKFLKMIFTVPDRPAQADPAANQVLVIGLMALLCLILGVWGDWFMGSLLGGSSYLPLRQQAAKLPQYLISYAGAYLLYRAVVDQRKWPAYLSGIDLSFNDICLAIVGFFAATGFYLNLTI